MEVTIKTSPGELADKLTILAIKSTKIQDPTKLAHVRYEKRSLERSWQGLGETRTRVVRDDIAELQRVNETLWEIEDALRDKERHQAFDAEFVSLARSVYRTNDERSRIKRLINTKLGSRVVEETSYSAY